MTLNNHIPFMAKNKVEKRRFIEKIFNLEIFSKMLTELRTDQSHIKQDFDINITRLEETNNYLDVQKTQSDNFDIDRTNKTKTLRENLEQHKADLKKANVKLNEIKKLDITPYNDKHRELDGSIDEKSNIKDKLERDIITMKVNLKNDVSTLKRMGTEEDTCPVCLRPMEDHDHERVEQEKNKLKDNITTNNTIIEGLNDDVVELKTNIDKIQEAKIIVSNKIADIEKQKYSIGHIEESIEYINRCIKEMEEELDNVNNETNTFENIVKELEEKINNITAELNSIKKSIDMLDVVKFIVSEEGVKSYIVKKILRNFNSKLTYYLKKLDSNSICIFNEYFEEEILNEKGKICLYNNFSGAERKAIDLACLFSFMDMRKAQGDVHYNLSFYDELFDSSLDEKGVDLVLEILNERVEKLNECVFVISHRKESIKSATGDIIFLEKHNGITKRVNFVD